MAGNQCTIKFFFALAVLLAISTTLFLVDQKFDFKTNRSDLTPEDPSTKNLSQNQVPDYVYKVLNHVIKYDNPMTGYLGGRIFYNREKLLPEVQKNGQKIKYKEWDVHPKEFKNNRGPERLVTSSVKTYYYTKDHYQSFQKIEP